MTAKQCNTQVLGFGFAEHDNSRQIAMNKAGVTIVHIGASPWRQICGRAFSGVSCEPYAGDGDCSVFMFLNKKENRRV